MAKRKGKNRKAKRSESNIPARDSGGKAQKNQKRKTSEELKTEFRSVLKELIKLLRERGHQRNKKRIYQCTAKLFSLGEEMPEGCLTEGEETLLENIRGYQQTGKGPKVTKALHQLAGNMGISDSNRRRGK